MISMTYGLHSILKGIFIHIVSMMFGIDLSSNMLSGEIPGEVGKLSHVKSLNFSHNSFTGRIPATLGNMIEIESLDLSHNELNGTIPWDLTHIAGDVLCGVQ